MIWLRVSVVFTSYTWVMLHTAPLLHACVRTEFYNVLFRMDLKTMAGHVLRLLKAGARGCCRQLKKQSKGTWNQSIGRSCFCILSPPGSDRHVAIDRWPAVWKTKTQTGRHHGHTTGQGFHEASAQHTA